MPKNAFPILCFTKQVSVYNSNYLESYCGYKSELLSAASAMSSVRLNKFVCFDGVKRHAFLYSQYKNFDNVGDNFMKHFPILLSYCSVRV